MKKKYLIAIILLAFSVYMGCKKDDDGGNGCEGVTSINYLGQTYNTIEIGNQCWMAENLNVGDMINDTLEMKDNGVIEKYCYDNEPANCDEYGGLYQWNEMMEYTSTSSVQGICPRGWYLPTDVEWTTLVDFLGGKFIADLKMKEVGTTHWKSPNAGATNESGFTAIPGGYLGNKGFRALGKSGYFWSSSEYNTSCAWFCSLNYLLAGISYFEELKNDARSVRCLKD
jgi:uncharacterized protein (TIGR02145 family)